jgi:hypothetical protein
MAGLEEAGGFLPFVFGTDPTASRGEQMRTALSRTPASWPASTRTTNLPFRQDA